MSKRSRYDDKIDKYHRKIRKLELKAEKRRHRIIYSSDSETNSDEEVDYRSILHPQEDENPENEHDERPPEMECVPSQNDTSTEDKSDDAPKTEKLPALDPDILSALGESTEETPKFGEKIHDNLACLWTPILRKGLNKEVKEKLLRQFLVPENCPLLQAPKLNPEILSAVSDATRARDKRVENVQKQLGLGITALNRALGLLIDNEANKLEAIKLLSDSCRILCDLHHEETQTRIKFVTPGLDKSFLSIVQDVDRDDTLFGNKLSDKIKASKVIEKQGLQIKKPAPVPKQPTSSSHSSTTKPRPQGNWMGPPRFQQNRGGRGVSRKTAPAGTSNRRAHPSTNQSKPHQNRNLRAPTRQL